MLGKLEQVCEKRGWNLKVRDALPDFYIWFDKEKGILNVSKDTQSSHIEEFINTINSSMAL